MKNSTKYVLIGGGIVGAILLVYFVTQPTGTPTSAMGHSSVPEVTIETPEVTVLAGAPSNPISAEQAKQFALSGKPCGLSYAGSA